MIYSHMCFLLPKKNKITLVFIKADFTGFLPLEGAVKHFTVLMLLLHHNVVVLLQRKISYLEAAFGISK